MSFFFSYFSYVRRDTPRLGTQKIKYFPPKIQVRNPFDNNSLDIPFLSHLYDGSFLDFGFCITHTFVSTYQHCVIFSSMVRLYRLDIFVSCFIGDVSTLPLCMNTNIFWISFNLYVVIYQR